MFARQPVAVYCLCVGIGLLGALGGMTHLLSDAEESLGLTTLYRLRGAADSPSAVVVVGIDNASAGALGLPPAPDKWPRRLHARLLEALSARKAKVVAFDMIFHEAQDRRDDLAFAAAMRDAGNVVLTQSIARQDMPVADDGGNRIASLNLERLFSAEPALAEAAAGQAPFPLPKVPVQLNQFWCFRAASGDVPTLPVVALHVYAHAVFGDFLRLLVEVDERLAAVIAFTREEAIDVRTMIRMIRPLHAFFASHATLASQALAALAKRSAVDLTPPHAALIRSLIEVYGGAESRYLNLYGPPGTIRTVSYHRVLDPRGGDAADAVDFTGAAVFVGQTEGSWIRSHDGFYTAFSGPSGEDISGVEIAATAFANLLAGRTVRPPTGFARLLLLMGWGALTVIVALRLPTLPGTGVLLLLAGGYLWLAALRFGSDGTWLPLVAPLMVQVPAAFVGGLVWKYRRATLDRRNIREAFGRYLPDDVVDRLSANAQNLRLGGQVFYGICLFTDAQNYTTLSETLDPGALTELMNDYYAALFEPIKANDGMVLQVVGDSVMALWSAPAPDDGLKRAACRAAIGIAAAVKRFNDQAGPHAMPTRVGIHAGEMLLGNIGAMNHFEYRPVGDIVNTASRLEGLNKFLGTHMLVSAAAAPTDGSVSLRPLGRFVFKGKAQPVSVHELRAADLHPAEEQAALDRLFADGLDAFRRRHWDEAGRLFDQAWQRDPGDGPSRFYRRYSAAFGQQPPVADWDGAVRLEAK